MRTVRHLLFDAVRSLLTLLAAFVLFATASQAAAGGLSLFGSDFHTPIANGDTTPQVVDGTDFGGTPVGQAVSHPFYLVTPPSPDITLTGTPDRVALSGTGAAAFKVTFLEYTSTLPTNYGARFVIQFLPATGGTFNATVTIQSDDSANPTYTFAITGTGNAPIVVTTTSDTPAAGQTTLREAITLANSQAGDDTITFDPSVTGTIQLTSALPDLSSNVTITGPGANVLAVRRADAAGRFRIFTIAPSATVDISGLTITNGYTADGASGSSGVDGGGILNSGTLHLARVAVSGNQTGVGGNASGGLSAGSGGRGGGLFNQVAATLTITHSTISGNRTGRGGDGSTSVGVGGDGGGLYTRGGTVTITHSTLSGNTAGAGGLLLIIPGGGVQFPGGAGGGIYLLNGMVTLTGSTLTANTSFGRGGGIYQQGTAIVSNTIIAGNSANASSADVDATAVHPVTSQGYNLIGKSDGSTGFTAMGDQTGTSAAPLDPRLGPLADNGGPTPTHALLFRSPAIDMGKNLAVDIIEFDVPGFPPSTSTIPSIFEQRGSRRTVDLADALYPNANGGDGTDIGAYEAQVEPPAPEIELVGNNQSIASGATVPTVLDGTDFGPLPVAGGAVEHTFTIVNLGPAVLNLTGTPRVAISGPDAADFTVTGQPATPVPAGTIDPVSGAVILATAGMVSFNIAFDPTLGGRKSATVTIASEDADEGMYTFAIAGTGVVPVLPTVSNPASAGVTPTTVFLSGNVTSDGNAPITERGVVFAPTATNSDPKLGEPNVYLGLSPGGIGVVTIGSTGLDPNTSYSFRFYATNSVGTGYSSVATFTTQVAGANDAVAATRAGTRIYPLANDVLPGSLPLRLVSVSNPAITIDGRSLVIPAGFTGAFTYTFTDGITTGQATVAVTDGVEVTNARSFSGLLLAPDGSIAGAVDATFSATGRTATVRMTAGPRVARFVVSFPAGSRVGSRFIGFGELTLTRDADGTVSASFASAGDLLTGSLRPRKASASVARYNVALASIDAAIPGGGYLFLSTTASSAAVLVGRLPDGQVFASSTSLRDDGTVAFHSIVRRGVNPRELVGGELVFADLLATDLTGELAWAKPIQRPGVPGLHRGGVNTILTANGCQFKGQPLPSGPGILRLSGGNLHLLEETPLMLRAGRPPGPTRSLVSWVADSKLGTFHARVDVLAVLVDGAGVYLPKSGRAWGFFPGRTVGGRIELTPP